MRHSSRAYGVKTFVAIFFFIAAAGLGQRVQAQAQDNPLKRYVCTDDASSTYIDDDIRAEKSDGYCGSGTKIEFDVFGATDMGTVTATRLDNGSHRVQIDIAWNTGKTGVMVIDVYYNKSIYKGFPRTGCKWTGRRFMYRYEIHREPLSPGGEYSGTSSTTVASNEAVSVFNVSYMPTTDEYLKSSELQATVIRYSPGNGNEMISAPIQRNGLDYVPTPVTYQATGKGTFVMRAEVYATLNGQCGQWYPVPPKTFKVISSCYLDDFSSISTTLLGPGSVYHPEDGSYTVQPETSYTINITGVTDFWSNFTLKPNGGEELTLTGNSFVVHQELGSYRIEAIPNVDDCPLPPPLQVLVGGQNIFVEEPCTITLPDYFTQEPYKKDFDDLVFDHFAAHLQSKRNIVLMPGVTLDLGAELFLEVEPDTEAADLHMNFTGATAFDEYGRLLSESRSYFDDSGRQLQTQYKNITGKVILANATLYDAYGRAALGTLPAPVVADPSRVCPTDDQDGRGMLFGFKPDFISAADGQRYNYTHFDLANEDSPAAVGNATEGTLGWYYSASNGNAPESPLHEPLVATTQYPYSRTLFHHDGSGNVKGTTMPGNGFQAGSQYVATTDMQAVTADDNYFNTDVKSYLSIRERELLLPRPATLEGQFFKTVTIDASGKKSVAYTDKAGQTIISIYFGMGAVPITTSYQFYDLTGRLLVSLSPNGLSQYGIDGQGNSNFDSIDKTRYFYNNKGWLMAAEEKIAGQETDGISRTEYLYRKDGSIRFSQSEEQRHATPQRYSYTNYDDAGRSVESGEFEVGEGGYKFNFPEMKSILESTAADGGLDDDTGVKRERYFTDYDEVLADVPLGRIQRFVHGGVSRTRKDDAVTSWYSYDERGRVEWMIQDITDFDTKTVDYRYGPTGQVQDITYQRDQDAERFSHFYEYDQDGRLYKVYTTRQLLAYDKFGHLTNNGITYDKSTGNIETPGILEHQATYTYYLHGPLKRVELSTRMQEGRMHTLQGIDYTYTIQGALKSINHADATLDPGGDGTTRPDVRADVFGMTLDYYSGDYLAAAGTSETVTVPAEYPDQRTGLIKAMRWHSPITPDKQFAYVYNYDQRNQFSNADWGTITGGAFIKDPLKPYHEAIPGYDLNGNISALQRNANILEPSNFFSQNFTYRYKENTNMLQDVLNVKGQDESMFRQYKYDDLGQMIQETQGDQSKFVAYDVSGKVIGVYTDEAHTQAVVTFTYDDRGFRLSKVSYDESHNPKQHTWYVRDASGAMLGTYEKIIGVDDDFKLSELPVYGSGRIGLYKPDYGLTLYELADHIGNVRAVIGGTIISEYMATMEEGERHEQEIKDFENVISSPAPEFINHTPAHVTVDRTSYTIENPSKVLRMNNRPAGHYDPKPIGTGILLWVHPGDVIDAEVFAKYTNFNDTNHDLLTALSGYLYTAFANTITGVDLSAIFNVVETPAFAALPVWAKLNDDEPQAFLNYLLFDNDFNLQKDGYDFDQVSPAAKMGATPTDHERLALENITIKKEGFMYIYVSNTSNQDMDVYFDDLRVKQNYSDIVAGGDHYPFGLPIKDRQIARDYYRHGYQGGFSEHDDETGWNHFELREYDPVIGRWLQKDPAGQYWSPYIGMGNNPLSGTDQDGGEVNDWVKNADGRYLWVDEAVDQSTTPLGWEYVGSELPAGVNSLDILVRVGDALYYQNTTNLFAKVYNSLTDGENMVEHKLYDAVAERALGEGIANGLGLTAGTYIYKGLKGVFALSARKSGTNIALGVSEHLDGFARNVNGSTWKTWGTKNFQSQFLEVINDTSAKIHFNLDGVASPMGAVSEGARGFGISRMTSWELFQIYSNPGALSRTVFYQGGKVVASPF